MDNIERENPFPDIWGTPRNDISLLTIDDKRIKSSFMLNNVNEKRNRIKRIGFDYMNKNYVNEDSIDINNIIINRRYETMQKGIRLFEVFYDRKPLIVKVNGEANLLVKNNDYNFIHLYIDSLNLTFADFIYNLNSNAFINRILKGENFYPSKKYSITGSNIVVDDNSIEGVLKIKIDESCKDTLTPFLPINDFDRHINIRYPTTKNELGISPRGVCRVICYLHFSHIVATNDHYNFTIYCKKCGYEII